MLPGVKTHWKADLDTAIVWKMVEDVSINNRNRKI